MPDESVDLVMTSPPYWQMRRYGDDPNELGSKPNPWPLGARGRLLPSHEAILHFTKTPDYFSTRMPLKRIGAGIHLRLTVVVGDTLI